VQLKKEELFQSSSASVEESSEGNQVSKSNPVVDKGDCSEPSSSRNLPPSETNEDNCATKSEIESDKKSLSEDEPGQLARLELTELDFQDDAELSVPPPPFRHANTVSTASLLSEDSSGIRSTHTSPAKAVYPSPVKAVYSTPLKSLQYSPTKSTRSSPDLKQSESPTKDESKTNASRGRRRQLTPTPGKTGNDQSSDIISKEVNASESTASEDKDDDLKLNIPNLRSRRSAASTPVPFTAEASSESPTKALSMPTESRVEVIDDFNFDGETEFISRVDNTSPKQTVGSATSKSKPQDDSAGDGDTGVTVTDAPETQETGDVKADISAESDEYFDALSDVDAKSLSGSLPETLAEDVPHDPSDPLQLKSPSEAATPDLKNKDTTKPSDDDTVSCFVCCIVKRFCFMI